MHVTAIIAAAGEGRRLGAPLPKQLLDLGGRSMLERSVAVFALHGRVDDVIVVLPAPLAAAPPDWLGARLPTVRVVAGGERRQDSVANAFDNVRTDSDIVLVHDAARPFVTTEQISRAIDGAVEYGAAIVALPVRDTVKQVDPAGPHPSSPAPFRGTRSIWRKRRRHFVAASWERPWRSAALASTPPTKRCLRNRQGTRSM